MGQCQYRYNPSELYQRTKPGQAPETICGARTYPALDEPEMVALSHGNGVLEMRETGRLMPRGYDDPFCPSHGGTAEPPPPPVTTAELESAYQSYMALASRFQAANPVAPIEVTAAVVPPAAPVEPVAPVVAGSVVNEEGKASE